MNYSKIEKIAVSRGYIVTEEGKCIGFKGKEIGKVSNNGYLEFLLRIDKKLSHCHIHRLQAFQKYGEDLYNEGMVVRHLDGNKFNNSWDNIAIGTNRDNTLDIPEQIRIKRARYATSFRKVKHDAEAIQNFYNSCKSYTKTMEEFSISSKGTLHFILNKIKYKSVMIKNNGGKR